jgi:hypothetical protein
MRQDIKPGSRQDTTFPFLFRVEVPIKYFGREKRRV